MPSPTEQAIALENQYGAYNYAPLPVVLSQGEGIFVTDVEGRRYYDCLSAYSAVNQGHCHPRIIQALRDQAERLTLVSRAFHTDQLGLFSRFACQLFGFDRLLMMNTGAEAVETAIKLCRKWGYQKKGIPHDEAVILVCDGNFHGRTTTIISFSGDENARRDFGPYTAGFVSIPYGDAEALATALSDPRVCGFLVEPIQGEAGVVLPDEGFLKKAEQLCRQHRVLLMADEIQTGIGRTGRLLACDHEDVRPDILMLGKAVSGGVYPVSLVLADDEVMLCLKPGQHGSTYGGNPLACAVARAALQVVIDEQLSDNAQRMGRLFRKSLARINSPCITAIRGKGLLNAIVVDRNSSVSATDICLKLASRGLLAKPTHDHIIRLAPPLIVKEADVLAMTALIRDVFEGVTL